MAASFALERLSRKDGAAQAVHCSHCEHALANLPHPGQDLLLRQRAAMSAEGARQVAFDPVHDQYGAAIGQYEVVLDTDNRWGVDAG